jgi:hypothetical protein
MRKRCIAHLVIEQGSEMADAEGKPGHVTIDIIPIAAASP